MCCPILLQTKLDEDLGALNIPPSVIRASSADLAEEVVSDYSTPSELPESETKINDKETRIQVAVSISRYVYKLLSHHSSTLQNQMYLRLLYILIPSC